MTTTDINRDTAIKAIRAALKERSGKSWSVRGGVGTAWGWITISAPPKRMASYRMTPEDSAELYALMGLTWHPRPNGVGAGPISVAASVAHYREYIARAEGRTPDEIAQPYWD